MSWLSDKLKEAQAQLNFRDGGRTAATVRRDRAKAAPAQTVRKPQPTFMDRVRTAGTGVALGATRSAIGLTQGVSGLYDLTSPGRGTNRFSKGLDRAAKFTDQTAKAEGAGASYKAGQLAGDALSFVGGGFAVKAASKLPQVARIANPVVRATRPLAASRAAMVANIASKGAGGRIAAKGVQAATSPSVAANVALGTGLDLGAEASKGRQITPGRAALSVGANAGFGVGLPMAGQVLREGGRATLNRAVKPVYAHQDAPMPISKVTQQPTTRPTLDVVLQEQPLPTRNTKKTSGIDKAFRSTRSVIERQGQSGQELAQLLRGSRDTKQLYLAELQKQLPTLRKIAQPSLPGQGIWRNKDFENFVDATQGIAPPRNARVAKAVGEWQQVHPTIRDRAVAAGLDVGDLGPNYYPHFVDYDRIFKDSNTYNKSINHLVESGQAKTPEEAISLLNYAKDVSRNRKFGNLEAAREVDLPFYDKTPNSLISYLSSSAKRIADTENFGAKDERALNLIKRIGQEGGDTEAAKNAFDVASGAKQYTATTSNISKNIRRYVTTTRLGLGALTNVSQNVNTGIVTGHLRTLGAAIKQLDPKTRAFVGDTGVIADAVLNDLRTQQGYETFGTKAFGKAVNMVTAPLFGTVERVNRSIAATAGRDYGLRLAQKGDIKTLRKLRVTGDIKNKTLTNAQQIQVARAIVEKTQFMVDPQDLPGWVDTPGGKLVAQFRTFSYNQGKFVSNEILKPAAHGDLKPLARLLAALPLGYALYETRRVIDGRPEEENKTKVGLQAFGKVGGAGLAFDIYQSINPIGSEYLPSDRRVTMAVGAAGGPAAGLATQAAGAVSESVQRKNVPEDEARLEGKVVAANSGDKYTDLTAATRFGLSQVPIVGTPIKNRVLPYKKESEADAGKAAGLTKDQQEQLRDLPQDDKATFIQASIEKNRNSGIKLPSIGKKEATKQTAVEKLKDQEKAQNKALKDSLSNEDYDLYSLSKEDRKKLIKSGEYTKEKFAGLDKYVERKKKELGIEDTSKSAKTIKGDTRGSALVQALNGMSEKGRKGWLGNSEMDNSYTDIYDRAQKLRFEGLPDLPKSNKVLKLYADLIEKRDKGMSKLSENKAKLSFLKEAYKTEVPKEAQEIMSASTNDILNGINDGVITPDQVAQAVMYDNFLISKGLSTTADIPAKVRKELKLGDAPTARGAVAKGKKGKKSSISYKLYGFTNPIDTSRSLRQLVKQAVLK